MAPRTDEQVTTYIHKALPSLDKIYRINCFDSIDRLKNYGLRGVNFINIYTSYGMLVKQTVGDDCELNMLKFIKDSLSTSNNTKIQNNPFTEITKLSHMVYTRNSINQPSQDYFLLIGYAIFAQKIALQKSRYRYLEKELEELKSKYGIIILDLDPA